MKITNPFEFTAFDKSDLEVLYDAGSIKKAIKSWYRNISNAMHPDKLTVCLGKNLPLKVQENVNAVYSMINNADDAQITAWIQSYRISGGNGTAFAEIQSLNARVKSAEQQKAEMQSTLQQNNKKVQELESLVKTLREQNETEKSSIQYELNAYKLQGEKQKEEIEKLNMYKLQVEKSMVAGVKKLSSPPSLFQDLIGLFKDIIGI